MTTMMTRKVHLNSVRINNKSSEYCSDSGTNSRDNDDIDVERDEAPVAAIFHSQLENSDGLFGFSNQNSNLMSVALGRDRTNCCTCGNEFDSSVVCSLKLDMSREVIVVLSPLGELTLIVNNASREMKVVAELSFPDQLLNITRIQALSLRPDIVDNGIFPLFLLGTSNNEMTVFQLDHNHILTSVYAMSLSAPVSALEAYASGTILVGLISGIVECYVLNYRISNDRALSEGGGICMRRITCRHSGSITHMHASMDSISPVSVIRIICFESDAQSIRFLVGFESGRLQECLIRHQSDHTNDHSNIGPDNNPYSTGEEDDEACKPLSNYGWWPSYEDDEESGDLSLGGDCFSQSNTSGKTDNDVEISSDYIWFILENYYLPTSVVTVGYFFSQGTNTQSSSFLVAVDKGETIELPNPSLDMRSSTELIGSSGTSKMLHVPNFAVLCRDGDIYLFCTSGDLSCNDTSTAYLLNHENVVFVYDCSGDSSEFSVIDMCCESKFPPSSQLDPTLVTEMKECSIYLLNTRGEVSVLSNICAQLRPMASPEIPYTIIPQTLSEKISKLLKQLNENSSHPGWQDRLLAGLMRDSEDYLIEASDPQNEIQFTLACLLALPDSELIAYL